MVELLSERLQGDNITLDDCSRTIEAVVVPAPAVADLEPFVSLLDPMAGIGLAVVRLAGLIDFDPLYERFSPRHQRPLELPARR
ncbi:MAG: hypothetical protein MUD06_14360 [Rhodospirillales bacterium]|nr:hypothetical protein [Rhodospirillales bacterium]